MKTFVQPGHAVTMIAPVDIAPDEVIVIGNIFGVSSSGAKAGGLFTLSINGVNRLPKAAVGLGAGAFAYWDGAAVTDDDNAGANFLIGVTIETVAANDKTVSVRLADPGFQTLVGSVFDITQKLDVDAGVTQTDFEATIDAEL